MIASATIRLQSASLLWKAAAVVIGTGILTLSSYIQVPMLPVPMTMQTLAVTLIGAFYGWRLGAATVLAWLVEGAAGLPVFAGGAAGLAYFLGPTGGYLVAFPFAAALVGWLVQHGWTRLLPAAAAMLLGNALCLLLGAAWLAVLIGPGNAVMVGVAPFILGAIVKSAIGAAALRALSR